jgi:hypothetical protein
LQVKRLTSSLAFICQNFYKTFKFLWVITNIGYCIIERNQH